MIDTVVDFPGRAPPLVSRRTTRSDIGGWLARTIDALLDLQERSRQRRALGRLDDRLLKDIGLSRSDVDRELDKPLWHA